MSTRVLVRVALVPTLLAAAPAEQIDARAPEAIVRALVKGMVFRAMAELDASPDAGQVTLAPPYRLQGKAVKPDARNDYRFQSGETAI